MKLLINGKEYTGPIFELHLIISDSEHHRKGFSISQDRLYKTREMCVEIRTGLKRWDTFRTLQPSCEGLPRRFVRDRLKIVEIDEGPDEPHVPLVRLPVMDGDTGVFLRRNLTKTAQISERIVLKSSLVNRPPELFPILFAGQKLFIHFSAPVLPTRRRFLLAGVVRELLFANG